MLKRKIIPFDFVLDLLAEKRPRTRAMFGCTAVYLEDKIVLILRDKKKPPSDDGVWLCTSVEHHESLRKTFPNMRSIKLFETPVTSWQVLPSLEGTFEADVETACEMILKNDPRIGRIPSKKKNQKVPIKKKLKLNKLKLNKLNTKSKSSKR